MSNSTVVCHRSNMHYRSNFTVFITLSRKYTEDVLFMFCRLFEIPRIGIKTCSEADNAVLLQCAILAVRLRGLMLQISSCLICKWIDYDC